MTFDKTLDDFGIQVWNSRNRMVTRFSYNFGFGFGADDPYDGVLEDCIASVFDIERDSIKDITKKATSKVIVVHHHIPCDKKVDELLETLAVMLALSISKRNTFPQGDYHI